MSSPPSFSIVAPAKINLYLHVIGNRDDGFHNLDSLVAFAGIQDTLQFTPADDLSLEIEGPFAPELATASDNLILQAARALAQMAGVTEGAHIRLTKRLPLASGIGGGSADAAATIKGLVRLWDIKSEPRDLQKLALTLGADVPVCLNGRAVFMGGIGEELSPAPALPSASLVLVNPGVALSTPAVFMERAQLTVRNSAPGRFDYSPNDIAELAAILKTRRNDLAPAALKMAPVIGQVLAELEGCAGALMARMSGSGATCFGLFEDPGEAAAATLKLSNERPDWWVRAGSLEADINRLN
jgi:4-diphosphocytidyl-2-C-methyl-D-erythritol kinase